MLDLSGVTFLDSTGIGVLVRARNRLLAAGGELILRSPSGIVRDVLEIVGLGDWIETVAHTNGAQEAQAESSR